MFPWCFIATFFLCFFLLFRSLHLHTMLFLTSLVGLLGSNFSPLLLPLQCQDVLGGDLIYFDFAFALYTSLIVETLMVLGT